MIFQHLIDKVIETDTHTINIRVVPKYQTVYVVFKDEYDQGCSWPEGAFSTYEKADKWVKEQNTTGWEIDSYIVDDKVL